MVCLALWTCDEPASRPGYESHVQSPLHYRSRHSASSHPISIRDPVSYILPETSYIVLAERHNRNGATGTGWSKRSLIIKPSGGYSFLRLLLCFAFPIQFEEALSLKWPWFPAKVTDWFSHQGNLCRNSIKFNVRYSHEEIRGNFGSDAWKQFWFPNNYNYNYRWYLGKYIHLYCIIMDDE